MLIFYAKYTLLMCAFLNIRNNRKCESQLNEASTGREIYLHAACTAKCLLLEKNRNFEECNDYCIHSKEARKMNATGDLKKINENHDLHLICRDDRSLSLKVTLPSQRLPAAEASIVGVNSIHALPHHRQLPTPANLNSSLQEVYLVNLSLADDAEDVDIYLSNDHFITIDNLRPNTTYNVSLAVVYSSNEYSIIAKGGQFTTLRRGYKPKEIPKISLLQFAADETDEMRVSALISWTPSYDKTCHYDLIYYSPEREDMEVTPIEIRNPQFLYTYSLENLTFATVYNVGIRAKNTNDSSKESGLTWEKFQTPSCIEWHNNNFNICAPLKPEGLTIDEHFLAANEFSLNVSWIHPKFEPDYYTLRILDLDQLHTYDVKSYIVNVTKERNWVFIPILTLKGMVYEAHLTAFTPGGNSTSVVRLPNKIRIQVSDTNQVLKLIIAILAPIFCIAILSLTTFIICHRRAKLKRYQERCKYFEELEKKAPIDPKSTFHFPTKTLSVPSSQDDLHQIQLDLEEKLFFNDEMEINRNDLTLFEILGEGAFGLVRRGVYRESKQNGKTNARDVAVKMLKDHPSVEDVRAFRREIEVMKSVGSHPNIVGIIGHCTRKYNEMLLLTEYCSLGNLQYFLRNEWKYLHELSFRTANNSSIPTESNAHSGRPLSSKPHRKLSESVFNFDSTMVEKIKLKYKNIYSTSSNGSNGYVGSLGGVTQCNRVVIGKDGSTKLPPANGRQHPMQYGEYNESYGHYEICTSACKCQVEIIGRDAVAELEKRITPKCRQIKISNKCDCRHKRSKLLSIDNESYYKNLLPAVPTDNAKETSVQGTLMAKREPLKSADLMDIAKQVAMGMEFLSKNKVVHRDLAARNILVSSDRTVKIADFGLSRDVYQENVYKKTGNGKLPIRWLALESMTHQVYTSQSDVWSYGILLYEIATLGGIPYPSIPTHRLLHLLKSGYRMEKPKNCGPQFYSLMLSCWNSNPSERPSFTEIIKILDFLLNDAPQLQVEQIVSPKLKQSPETVTSDDSYLKPL